MKRSPAQRLWVATLALGLIAGGACTKKEEVAPPSTSTAPAAPALPTAPPPGVNPITGTVKLLGAPPEMKTINFKSDSNCGRGEGKDEEVVVGPGGGLKNVLVRLTKGVTGSYPTPAAQAVIDQTACMYRPRMQGIMAGQQLMVRNSDQTMHNVHAANYNGGLPIFNQVEIPGMPPLVKTFNGSMELIKFKCDVHPWMLAYIAVSKHPFFAVTGDDGKFTIAAVPAGTYTLEAWHERYGATTAEVVVSAEKAGAVDLAFGGTAKASR